MSAVENEVTRETVEFSHFDRKWHTPAKQRLSHMVAFRNEFARTGNEDLAMCVAYLPQEEFVALLDIDPDADQLDAFTDEIAKALGFKDSGNS